MGYTTVRGRQEAVAAAARLSRSAAPSGRGTFATRLPLLIDQVMAEAGVYEPHIAELALDQAAGDIARACSLIRAWTAVLPRLGSVRVDLADLRALRRVTPGFVAPPGGQYLGASQDYAQRLLELDGHAEVSPNGTAHQTHGPAPAQFPPSRGALAAEGLLAPPDPPAEPVDVTRSAEARSDRGALLHLLSRAETGAMTAIAYTAVRGFGALQDPTLIDLRSGRLAVRVTGPEGEPVTVGEVPVTFAEMVLYRMHGGVPDPRLTLGVGATVGGLERRAISAALLDATTSRAAGDVRPKAPSEDAEFLAIALDGQEATGFVEHLKLPHHVTFTSDLDRIRAARRRAEESE